MRPQRTLGIWFSALALGACARNATVETALHGNLASLRQRISEEQAAGTLSSSRVRDLARAVAEREVMSGEGASGVRRIRGMRACSEPLEGALKARAERADDGGAEAAQVLLTTHALSPSSYFERYHSSSVGPWRAVAARAATHEDSFFLRRHWFVDPDERVRRAAFEAALEAPAEADLDVLLEATRLDPDPLGQDLAARAVGAIGGQRAVLALVNRWDRALEEQRIAFVDAWSMPRSLGAGGEGELVKVAESGKGMPSLAAAAALARAPGPSNGAAVTWLVRGVSEGSSEERRFAIASVPLADPAALRALHDAAKDGDNDVRISALSRLLDRPEDHASSLAELRKLASAKVAASSRAAHVLAEAHDQSVRPLLLEELRSKSPAQRQSAALALAKLGDYSSGASVLADEEATTRASFACALLTLKEP